MRDGTGISRAALPVGTDEVFRELADHRRRDLGCADLLQFRSLVTARQYKRLYEVVQRYVPPGAAVLDWGCGNGHVSYTLARLGYLVTGFSFEEFGLRRHIRSEYRLELGSETSPSQLPFGSGRFEAVLSVGVLEHVRETGGTEAASLEEIARVLRPDGVFVCYHLPNRHSAIEAFSRRFFPAKYSHPYRYTPRDIQAMCVGAGLELVETQRYGALPRNIWHRTPERLRNSSAAADLWDRVDSLLARSLAPIVQNHLFVARKGTR